MTHGSLVPDAIVPQVRSRMTTGEEGGDPLHPVLSVDTCPAVPPFVEHTPLHVYYTNNHKLR